MTKHIGIISCSAEGAALCYRTICIEAPSLMGRYTHPEITMHSLSLSEYMRYIEAGEWQNVASLMLSSVVKVARTGAHFAICPDNTIHQAFHLVVKKSPIPWLNIAEEVAAEAKRHKYKSIVVVGTRFLMEGSVYPDVLNAIGIECRIPELKDREVMNEIIFSELIWGRFSSEARTYFTEVIGRFKNQGCDAVILGCTEIPLLITQETSPLPILDSTRLLARAAIKEAITTRSE